MKEDDMSKLPEISTEKYAARWRAEATSNQDDLFKVECLAEALLEERDAAIERAEKAEAELATYKNDATEDASA